MHLIPNYERKHNIYDILSKLMINIEHNQHIHEIKELDANIKPNNYDIPGVELEYKSNTL